MIFLKCDKLCITAGSSYYGETSFSTHDQLPMFGNAQNNFESKQKRERKPRIQYRSDHVEILEEVFVNDRNPNIFTRERIAKRIKCSEARVQVIKISRYHVDCFNELYTSISL